MANSLTFSKNGKYSGKYTAVLEFGASDSNQLVSLDLSSVTEASDFIKEAKKGPVAITIEIISCAISGTPNPAGITELIANYDSSTNTLSIDISISATPGSGNARTYTIKGNIFVLHSLVK
jgi:hypothetical protein